MENWMIWSLIGATLVIAEFVLPGGIVVFLGVSALVVGGALYLGWIDSLYVAFMTWFITSILSLIFLRTLFMKFFEGDSQVQNVNEEEDLVGALVEVVEDIYPYKEGRVRFRESTWSARCENEVHAGQTVRILERDGNCLIVKVL